jgi:hypothetical protein
MRAPLLLPISIALLAAFPALAQDAPRVLFCSGPCFAVDANGVRTPAPKGTVLRPNQRFETGAGGYAQIKLAPDTAMALGESARVRIDQTRLQEPVIVNLDLGRARMLLREVGKPIRPIELHTADGKFLLRDVDVEIRKSQIAAVGSNVTVVKVNAGDAMLRAPQGDISVGKGDLQGIAGGKVLPQPIPRTEIALTPPPTRVAMPLDQPVATIRLPDIAVAASLRGELAVSPTVRRLPPTVTAPLPGSIADAPIRPVLTTGELVPYTPVITSTGEVKTLTTYVLTDPVLSSTSLTTTKSLELVDTSTSLSTSSLSSINLTTTTSTSLTDTTTTMISTSPTLVTTTTTTTSTLSTSPITTTTIQPITISPILIR